MRKVKWVVLLLLVSFQALMAQNYQTIEDVNEQCTQLGYISNEEAEIAVDEILSQLGLARNFTIIECPDINNAVAKMVLLSNGNNERFILYDNSFFNKINENASTDWAATSILAHEIGHHLNNHSLNNKGSNHKFELEADEFSGFVLAKMGASLVEAQSALASLKYGKATYSHPAKVDRLNRVEKGWLKGSGQTVSNNTTSDIKDDPIPETDVEVPFSVVEKSPVFPGCSGTSSELKKCLNEGIAAIISENFNGNLAQELGLKGKIRITMIWKINKYGYITDVSARAPDARLEAEAKRVIRLIPRMEPGTISGKPVTIPYTMPIVYLIE